MKDREVKSKKTEKEEDQLKGILEQMDREMAKEKKKPDIRKAKKVEKQG